MVGRWLSGIEMHRKEDRVEAKHDHIQRSVFQVRCFHVDLSTEYPLVSTRSGCRNQRPSLLRVQPRFDRGRGESTSFRLSGVGYNEDFASRESLSSNRNLQWSLETCSCERDQSPPTNARTWRQRQCFRGFQLPSVQDFAPGSFTITSPSVASIEPTLLAQATADDGRQALIKDGFHITPEPPEHDDTGLRIAQDLDGPCYGETLAGPRSQNHPHGRGMSQEAREPYTVRFAPGSGQPGQHRALRSQPDLVAQCLAQGADPNTRKRVTITVNVLGLGVVTDTALGESVLVMAVIMGMGAAVQMLLERGCDVHQEVGWKIANYSNSWSIDTYRLAMSPRGPTSVLHSQQPPRNASPSLHSH
ncbi:hypothetical protein M427DRAFT_147543, partial [Gonapodya prolifera JEL478]